MYLCKLHIKNLKLIRDLELDFTRDGEPRMWTVLLAENGMCKTALLQAIGLAASGKDRANQLADVPSLPDLRVPSSKMKVSAEFQVKLREETARLLEESTPRTPSSMLPPEVTGIPIHRVPRLRSELWVEPGASVFSGCSTFASSFSPEWRPLETIRALNHPHWLVVGYGVGRRLPEPKSTPPPRDPALQRMQPLYDRGSIAGTDFIDFLKARKSGDRLALGYVRQLNKALMGENGVLPRITKFERRGQGGVKTSEVLLQSHRFSFDTGSRNVRVPATWLSQGYQATIAWVADLLGQAWWDSITYIEENPGYELTPADVEGLVLIDELDMHLHPRWQVGLVQALRRTFPRVQFVVTTHSPMLLAGFERDEIVLLEFDSKGNVQARQVDESPKLMTGSELYDRFFGLQRLFPSDLGEALMRYGLLASDPGRSQEDDEEVQRLREQLHAAGEDPGWDPVPVQPELQDPENAE